jgi:hypothetical protein
MHGNLNYIFWESQMPLSFKIQRTIILHIVLYGCATLRQKHMLGVLENGVLRQIFGSKRDENGEWRRLYNEELHSLYCLPNITIVIKSRRSNWRR